MTTLLIVLFALSLVYITVAERFRTFTALIGIQGILLFGISYFELKSIDTLNLVFIFTETIAFKTIMVPWLLHRIIKGTGDTRAHNHALPGYYAILLSIGLLFLSYLLGYYLTNPMIDKVYLMVSLFGMFTGLLFVILHRKIFSHLIGFLILENAVFIFSVALGNRMPMLINAGILLDIFISVLILGFFMTKIGEKIQTLASEELTMLKD